MGDDRPIIIKKVKGGHSAPHGGAWKVAYADFVTAMMAFFLVMWILGLNQETRKAIAAYFNDPTGMMKSMGGGKHPTAAFRADGRGRITVLMTGVKAGRGAESARFQEAKKQLEKALEKSPEFKALRKYVEIRIAADGLRIELLDGPEPVFFEMGSAQIKDRTRRLLDVVSRQIGALPNHVAIEGYTDSRPYAGGLAGYSNWELSADRANAARRAMLGGLHADQVVEVRGYADHRLRDPEDPYHFSNRRVTILVKASEDGEATRKAPQGPLGIDLTRASQPSGGASAH